MANYDDIKKKAKDALETLADVSVEAYKIAEDKAKVFARRTKLNAEITREKALIRRKKFDIGGIYYDLHKCCPDEALKEHCDAITASLDLIADKRAELEYLKTNGLGNTADDCGCAADKDPACECADEEPPCECVDEEPACECADEAPPCECAAEEPAPEE